MKRHWALLGCIAVALSGCSSMFGERSVRSQSPDADHKPSPRKLVGDLAVGFGMDAVRVEGIGLVVGLPDTGSDPPPSPERSALLAEMRTRNVEAPNKILASKKAALVFIQGYLRPGVQKGDQFDLEVRVPSRSETTSLAGGYLLEAHLREIAIMGNQVHDSFPLAIAKGPVLVDPGTKGEDPKIALCRGRVLGGGISLKTRKLGLVLKPEHKNVAASARIAESINRRFHGLELGGASGVAKAKTDQFIELDLSPRYRNNVERFVHVVRAVAIKESAAEQSDRIARLKREVQDPDTTSDAARQLEAIGTDGVEPLLAAIKSENEEVRFYSAESLAYLDRAEAAPVLGEAARSSAAFRVFAMTALSTMTDRAAFDQLADLLNSPSAETRYGAFRSLLAMNANDPLVADDPAVKNFSYHIIDTDGPPMVHVTRNRRAEIVLFGRDQRVKTPLYVAAGNHIQVTSTAANEIAVSRYAVGQSDQKRIVSTRLDEVIRAIVELGGQYPDVVHMLEQAKAGDALIGRFAVDALPEAGRFYDRASETELADAKDKKNSKEAKETDHKKAPKVKPTDLFSKSDNPRGESASAEKKTADKEKEEPADADKKPSIFQRMWSG